MTKIGAIDTPISGEESMLEGVSIPSQPTEVPEILPAHIDDPTHTLSQRMSPPKVVIKSFAQVVEKEVSWLLKGVIPMGEVSVIAGNPGEGKSFLTSWLAAAVSGDQPTNFRDEPIPQGVAIICNAEDTDGLIKTRLRQNRANMERVKTIKYVLVSDRASGEETITKQPITLEKIDEFRETFQKNPECKLLVVDPVSAHWGNTNGNNGSVVRKIIAQLKSLAEEFGVAIVLVTHLNKSGSKDVFIRTSGSGGLLAAVRAGWLLSTGESELRTIACIKSNVSASKTGFTFEIEDGQVAIVDKEVDVTANDLLQEAHKKGAANKGEKETARYKAADWLREFLKGGRKPAGSESCCEPGSVYYESYAAGHAWRTIRRASEDLKIRKLKECGISYWELSDDQKALVQNASPSCPTEVGQVDDTENAGTSGATCPLVQKTGVQENVEQTPVSGELSEVLVQNASSLCPTEVGQVDKLDMLAVTAGIDGDEMSPAAEMSSAVNLSELVSPSQQGSGIGLPICFAEEKGFKAKGSPTGEGDEFMVFAGSTINPTESDSLPDAIKVLRAELVKSGEIDEKFSFVRDYPFTSRIIAARVVSGDSVYGKTFWKVQETSTEQTTPEATASDMDADDLAGNVASFIVGGKRAIGNMPKIVSLPPPPSRM